MLESRANIVAGRIADAAVELLKKRKITTACVFVYSKESCDWPMAIATPDNDGFGTNNQSFYRSLLSFRRQATLQALYAQTTDGRSSAEQTDRLRENKRSASSYGIAFDSEQKSFYARDTINELTVITVAPKLITSESTKISEKAIKKANSESTLKQNNASKLINACLNEISKANLPEDRTAFAMISLPTFRSSFLDCSTQAPAIVCSRPVGCVSKISNFSIIEAKTHAVQVTGKASGPETQINLSRILGAVPAFNKKYGEKIIAAGGLVNCKADVQAIFDAMKFLPINLQFALIEQLTR